MAKTSGDESEPKENDKLNNPGNGDNGSAANRGPAEVAGKEAPTRTQMMQERWDSAKTFISANYYRIILVLFALVLFLFLTVITLSFILGTRDVVTFPMKCESAPCLKAAALTLSSLDTSYDTCEDFWSYSCGNWIKSHKVPPEKGLYTVKDVIRKEINLKLLNLINTASDRDRVHGLTIIRKFYSTCMDSDRVEHHSDRMVDEYLRSTFGGWHPMDKPKTEWQKLLEYLQKDFGVTPFFRITVEVNDYDPTAPTIKIVPAGLGLPSREHYWDYKYERIQRAYRKYIEDLSHQIGVPPSDARRAAENIFNYEKKLADGLSQTWNVSMLLERTKMRDLRSSIPSIKWLEFIQSYSALKELPFRDNTEIILQDKAYFRSLANILSITSDDVFNTYMIWQFLHQYAPYFGEDFRSIHVRFREFLVGIDPLVSYEKPERWEFCIETIKKHYGLGVTSLLLEKEVDKYNLGSTEKIVENVRETIKRKIDSFPWVRDRETIERLRDKIEAVNVKIGYPDNLPDPLGMEKYYIDSIVDTSLIKSVAYAYSHQRKKMFEMILQSGQRAIDVWPILPIEPEAYYQHAGNVLYVGFGLLNSPIYETYSPMTMNYGAFAFHIATELLKAINFKGIFYDRTGQLSEGFITISEDSAMALNSTVNCLSDKLKYQNSTLLQQIDIDLVIPQTITDIDALHIAFEAYKLLVLREGQEHPLPGLSLYNDQLFFVSFAQSLCESVRERYADNFYETMSTLPGKQRVETVVHNIPQFSKSFNCRSHGQNACPLF